MLSSNNFPFSGLSLASPPQSFVNEPGWNWQTTIPNYYNLWVCTASSTSFLVNSKWHGCPPGTAFLFAPHDRVLSRQTGKGLVRNFTLHFTLDDLADERINKLRTGFKIQDFDGFQTLAHRAVDAGRRREPFEIYHAQLLALALLAQIWREIITPESCGAEQKVHNIIRCIDAQPGKPRQVQALALQCGLSRSQFTRIFTKATTTSPINYVLERRIDRAKVLLRESTMQISQIAHALGYSDIYFFSRQFKSRTGQSPKNYRSNT